MLQGLLEVKIEALEEFGVMGTSSCMQLLSSYLVALGLEHVACGASLGDLVLNPSLLGLQQSTVLAGQIGCLSDQEVRCFAHVLFMIITISSGATV